MVKIAALYHFVEILDVPAFKEWLLTTTQAYSVQGMLIIATEGINGTIAADDGNLTHFLSVLTADPRFQAIHVKYSYADSQPFYHMRVSVRKEIVTMGVPGFTPNTQHSSGAVIHIHPAEWNVLITQENILLIDTRNEYEIRLGTFKNAQNPHTSSFSEFPNYLVNSLIPKTQPIAMFCTGGIRCDKMSSYMVQQGYEKIYNLAGGILNYLEHVQPQESLWEGECFVFDQRVTVTHGLEPGNCTFCSGCRYPLLPSDREHVHFLQGVHCGHCYEQLTDEQVAAAKERNLQIALAEKKGVKHLGYVHQGHRDKSKSNNKSSKQSSKQQEEEQKEPQKEPTAADEAATEGVTA